MRNFTLDEFSCPCCGEVQMDYEQIEMLDEARELAGVPFKVNSGYRCKKHNENVGGSPNSSHPKGYATDIAVRDSESRFKILKALLEVGFTRIGVYKTFIHCDNDPDKPQGVCWYI